MVEISNKELENIVLEYVWRKHADLKTDKWTLEDFDINWACSKTDDATAASLFYTMVKPIKDENSDSKCSDNCSRRIDPYSSK